MATANLPPTPPRRERRPADEAAILFPGTLCKCLLRRPTIRHQARIPSAMTLRRLEQEMIVHLNGWPGAGKKTIGEELARRLGARFIHNHLLHDVAIVCAGFHSSHRWELYENVRAAAYGALARHPRSEIFVMTNALCNDTRREEAAWKHVVELAIARDVPLVPVVLEVSLEENIRRLQSPGRTGRKLTDRTLLRDMIQGWPLQHPDVPERIVVDVSDCSPEQAAHTIQMRLDLLMPTLRPATLRHLRMVRA